MNHQSSMDLMQEHTLPENRHPQPRCLGSPGGGHPPPPALSMGDVPGEGSLGVPKSRYLGLASSSIALRSCKGTEEVGWGPVPSLSPSPPCCPLVPSFSPTLPPRLPPPAPHLHPADGSHQLPDAGDEDALQLQQLEEVMGLGEVTTGTRGDKATPAPCPLAVTQNRGGRGGWCSQPHQDVCVPPKPGAGRSMARAGA